MANKAELLGVLGFATLFGAFFGLVLSVGILSPSPNPTGLAFLENAVIGVPAGIVVFITLALVYLFTLGESAVERDSLQPEWRNLKPDLSALRR